jgi:hypothetical protein
MPRSYTKTPYKADAVLDRLLAEVRQEMTPEMLARMASLVVHCAARGIGWAVELCRRADAKAVDTALLNEIQRRRT